MFLSKEMEEQKDIKKNNRWLHITYLSIILLLVCSVAMLATKLYHQKIIYREIVKVQDNTQQEKETVTRELNNLLEQYESLKTNNKKVNKELEAEREKIEKMIQEVKNLKASNFYQIKQYKDEIETLKKVMRNYVVQIDSLNTVNIGLKTENVKVKHDIEKEKTVSKDLAVKNEELTTKVNVAAVLKAQNIAHTALNKRGKEITKARKVEKFKICFTILENDIALVGSRDVYMRIARPDGLVLATSEQNLFKFGNEQIVFSAKRQIDYQNKNIDVCIFWDNNQELIPGTYTVDLFSDGNLIGTSKFTLK